MTPGGYHGFAFRRDAGVDFRDPDSTKDLEKYAKAVKVTEGERQSVQLTITPNDQ